MGEPYIVQQSLANKVRDYIEKAKDAKQEMLKRANKWAKKFGGTVVVNDNNIKSFDSIMRKLKKDKKSNPNELKDIVRTTVVVPNNQLLNAMKFATQEANKLKNGQSKIQEGDKYHGYVGFIFNHKARNGVWYEIQINTPEMIYAKESISVAKQILGSNNVRRIFNERGHSGAGLGHRYYERIRTLPEGSKEWKKTSQSSQEYYSIFR